MSIFKEAQSWDADKEASSKFKINVLIGVSIVFALAFLIAVGAWFKETSRPKQIPVVFKTDSATGNVEVLQAFDNRLIEKTALTNMHWAKRYVISRESYDYYIVGVDYDFVNRTSAPDIVAEYNNQFKGPNNLDKVFGTTTKRKIKVISVSPVPGFEDQITVTFERTTISNGVIVEQPTLFVSHVRYRYKPTDKGALADLIDNPMGFEVFGYRRDAQISASSTTAADPSATSGVSTNSPAPGAAQGAAQ